MASRVTKKEREKVAVWRARLAWAEQERKKMKEKVWDENLDFLFGQQYRDIEKALQEGSEHQIVVNRLFPIVRTALPSLIFQHPHFYVRATGKPEIEEREVEDAEPDEEGNLPTAAVDISQERAKSKEHWLNHHYVKARGHYHCRLAAIASFYAFGAIKVGFQPDLHDTTSRGEFLEDDDGNLVMTTDEKTGVSVPKLAQGDYLRDEKGQVVMNEDDGLPELDPGSIATSGQYVIRWMPPECFLFDPEGMNDESEHRWIAEEWVLPLEEVRNDPNFKHRTKIEGTHEAGFQPGDDSSNRSGGNPIKKWLEEQSEHKTAIDDDMSRVRGWYIWDMENRELLTLADCPVGKDGTVDRTQHEFFLREETVPDSVDAHPYEFCKLNEYPGRFEPYADLSPMVPIQEGINEQRSRQLTHMRRSDRKYLYEKDTFDGVRELEKLKTGGDMSFAKVNPGKRPIPLEMAVQDPIHREVGVALELDLQKLAVVTSEKQGMADAKTATQAMFLDEGDDLRREDRRAIFHDFVKRIGQKLLRVGRVHADHAEWVAIGDPRDETPFKFRGEITPEDLEGDAEVGITVGSLQSRTTATERQQWIQLWGFLAQARNTAVIASRRWLRTTMELFHMDDEELVEEIVQLVQQQLQAEAQSATTGGAGASDASRPGATGSDIDAAAGGLA